MLDVSDTVIAKSDQLNADDLIGGPVTVKITQVSKKSGDDQPMKINFEGDNGRPFKPCKTVRRILIAAWGKDALQWQGRLMTLYCDPDVKWAGKPVGGIRVSHLSHIDKELNISLSETRGMKKPHNVKPLQTDAATQGAPPAAQQSEPQGTASTENILKVIRGDGSHVEFQDEQTWLSYIQTNLVKITDIAQLNAFEQRNKEIFEKIENFGLADIVEFAKKSISESRERLGGGDAQPL